MPHTGARLRRHVPQQHRFPLRPAAKPIKIVVGDAAHPEHYGVPPALSRSRDLNVLASAHTGPELIELVDRLEPDVVLTEVMLPELDAIEAIARIRAKHPAVRVMVWSMLDAPEFVVRARVSGACGYLRKDADALELGHAVRSVAAGGEYLGPSAAQALLTPAANRLWIREVTRRSWGL